MVLNSPLDMLSLPKGAAYFMKVGMVAWDNVLYVSAATRKLSDLSRYLSRPSYTKRKAPVVVFED